jgi:N-acetylmuramoyl-L-alanine amidase
MRLIIQLLFVSVLFLFPTQSFATRKKVSKIVIDAGHGGKDFGAPGTLSHEKDLTLAISLRLGKMIEDSLGDVQVIYTRTSDFYPTLTERHEIANQAKADLFVAIHINANPGTSERSFAGYKTTKHGKKKTQVAVYHITHHRQTPVQGTETYVLGLHRNSQKEGAIEENSEDIAEETGLLDESDPQTAIIIAQYSQAFLSRSVSLASKIQQEFSSQGRRDFGVKQKGLEVLAGSAMPGVLVECGFINNLDEEAYMNSENGQQEITLAIFRGIKAYKLESER